jgi:glutamine synthetase
LSRHRNEVLTLFVDLLGKPSAKLAPVSAVPELAADGVVFAGYAVGAMGQTPKDPDLVAMPDPASFTPIPFVKPGLALVRRQTGSPRRAGRRSTRFNHVHSEI